MLCFGLRLSVYAGYLLFYWVADRYGCQSHTSIAGYFVVRKVTAALIKKI